MKLLKRIAIATALSSITFAASAMTPIADTELSQVSGQDGVSIAANLNVNIGSFVYGTANGAEGGGNVAFNNISITGDIAATLDILGASKFSTAGATASTGEAYSVLGVVDPVAQAGGAANLVAAITYLKTVAAGGTPTGTAPTAAQAAAAQQAIALAAFYPGTDVVRIAVPNIAVNNLLNIKVDSITMGTNGVQNTTNPSFGSFALNNVNLAGTTAYIWAH